MDQGDSANARTMFQQYVSQAENGAKGFNGLALCDIEDGDYDSALSNISSGIHVADAEDMQSLLFNEIAVLRRSWTSRLRCRKRTNIWDCIRMIRQ